MRTTRRLAGNGSSTGMTESHGYSIAGRDIPVARLLAIAKTDAEAAEIAREAQNGFLRLTYTRNYSRTAETPFNATSTLS